MPACCSPSARAVLLKPERSRWLGVAWLAIHGLAGVSLLLTEPALALAGMPVLVAHAWLSRPRSTPLIVITGRRFALPAEQRYGLTLAPSARLGGCWAELVFTDMLGARVLVFRDQLDAAGWRRLRLAFLESD